MSALEPIFATMDAQLRAKTAHAFLVTGNIGDDFPAASGRIFRPFEAALAAHYPHRIFLQLDLVRGLEVRTRDGVDKLKEVLEPASGKPKDPIDQQRAAAEDPDDKDVLAETVGGGLHVLRALIRTNVHKLLVWVPRLPSIAPAGCNTDASVRATVDALTALFRDAAASENEHLFVFGATTASMIESKLIDAGSRLVQVKLPKPDEEQRLAAIRQLTLDEDERRRLEENEARIREARREIWSRYRELYAEHRPEREAAQERLAGIERRVQDQFAIENREHRDAISRLETQLQRANDRLAADDAEGLRLYETWLRDQQTVRQSGRIVASCERDVWKEAAPGDRIYQCRKGEISWLVVLERREQETVLSFPVFLNGEGLPVRPMTKRRSDEIRTWSWDARANDALAGKFGRLHNRNPPNAEPLQPCLVRLPGGMHPAIIQDRIKVMRAEEADALGKRMKRVEIEVATARSGIDRASKQIRKIMRDDRRVLDLQEELRQASAEKGALLKDRFPPPDMPVAALARITSGLGYRDLRDLFALAMADGVTLDRGRVSRLKLKRLTDTYGHLMEIVEPTYGFEGIGGLEELKAEMREIVNAVREGDRQMVPMGMLLMGPPGTGKTAIAEALALETGFTFIKLRNTRSKWVGESERQTEEILDALMDLAPCVILRDEVDQEDSGRDAYQGDSGVSGRIRQKWMQFLSDPRIRGRVLVVSCTNRPDLLDPAMKRSGRTDLRIPLPAPDVVARERIFEVMFSRHRYGISHEIGSFAPFAERTRFLSGADIEAVCLESQKFARRRGCKVVTEQDLGDAIDDFIPSADQLQILIMTAMAIRATSSRRFLPKDLDLPLIEREMEQLREERVAKPDAN